MEGYPNNQMHKANTSPINSSSKIIVRYFWFYINVD